MPEPVDRYLRGDGDGRGVQQLRDGVVVAGYLDDPTKIAASFFRSCQAVVHCAAGS